MSCKTDYCYSEAVGEANANAAKSTYHFNV